ncbi:MAG: PKD domain-containing protein [Thermoleophilia bacterium]
MTARRMTALVAALGLLAVAGPAAAARGIAPPPPATPPPPTASFTIAPSTAATGALVTFDANGSRFDRRTPLTYRWDFDGDGTYDLETDSRIVTFRYLTPGPRDVALQVVEPPYGDAPDQTDTTTRRIQVIDHPAPLARILNPPAAVLVHEPVTLHGAATYLSDTDVVYAWELDGNLGRRSSSPDLDLAFTTPGAHTVRLFVTDSLGSVSSATAVIRVHTPPVAAFTAQGPAVAGSQVILDGGASSDDGAVVRYEWDTDGNGTYETDAGPFPAHFVTFATPGVHRVGLRVTDADGATGTTTRDITVASATPDVGPPPPQPTVRAVRGRVAIPVSCPPGPARTVTVRLRGTGTLAGKLLGAATLRVTGGGSGTASIPLSSAALRELGRAHTLRTTLVTRIAAAAASAPVVTRGPLAITG